MSYIGNSPTSAAFPSENFSGNGSTTAFTMSVAPANTASVFVFISGVKQDPTTYSVNGTTLTFSAAPPSGTNNISVIYMGIPASGVTNTAYRTVTEFTATAGQTTFSVPSYTVGFITVLRNGVRLNSADFTASNGTTVVLTNAATAGDAVTTESFYISSVINAIPSVAGAVNSTYLLDGAVTQAKLGTNVAGNGPAMVAYQNAQTSLSAGVVTKINFQLSLYDTNSNYSTSTSKFTPTVAGYYFINAGVSFNNACSSQGAIYKNGTAFLWTSYPQLGNGFVISGIVQMNGSTDYIEIDGYSSVANQTQTGVTNSQFQAFLIRSL